MILKQKNFYDLYDLDKYFFKEFNIGIMDLIHEIAGEKEAVQHTLLNIKIENYKEKYPEVVKILQRELGDRFYVDYYW
jgi:hypothetical protein